MRDAGSRDPRGNIRRSTNVIRRHPSDLFLAVDHETKLGDIVELNVEVQALLYWIVEPFMAQGELVRSDGVSRIAYSPDSSLSSLIKVALVAS